MKIVFLISFLMFSVNKSWSDDLACDEFKSNSQAITLSGGNIYLPLNYSLEIDWASSYTFRDLNTILSRIHIKLAEQIVYLNPEKILPDPDLLQFDFLKKIKNGEFDVSIFTPKVDSSITRDINIVVAQLNNYGIVFYDVDELIWNRVLRCFEDRAKGDIIKNSQHNREPIDSIRFIER